MIDQNTFGKTPAAKYLARELSRPGNDVLIKSVTRRIVSTNTAVNDLVSAYECERLSAKTLANCLRLMREEIAKENSVNIIDQLRQNVQIGLIKRGIRQSTIARKAERVMVSPETRSIFSAPQFCTGENKPYAVHYEFKDKTSGHIYGAGLKTIPDGISHVYRVYADSVKDVSPEILMERSNRRCARQGKPHMSTSV